MLTPISRAISAAVRPASSCFTTFRICSSLNFLFDTAFSPFFVRISIPLRANQAVHVKPGILFAFTPERFSRSPRNRVHLRPESAITFDSVNCRR